MNRYNSKYWENSAASFGFESQAGKSADVDDQVDWSIDFESEQEARAYLDRQIPRIEQKVKNKIPSGLQTKAQLDDFKKRIKDAKSIINQTKIIKK